MDEPADDTVTGVVDSIDAGSGRVLIGHRRGGVVLPGRDAARGRGRGRRRRASSSPRAATSPTASSGPARPRTRSSRACRGASTAAHHRDAPGRPPRRARRGTSGRTSRAGTWWAGIRRGPVQRWPCDPCPGAPSCCGPWSAPSSGPVSCSSTCARRPRPRAASSHRSDRAHVGAHRRPTSPDQAQFTYGESDGPMFYAVARDFWDLDRAAESLDRPRYRLTRPAYPFFGWLLHPRVAVTASS